MKLTEIKRENILEAAAEEFRFHGFEGARISRIAELAEVSTRTLYKHFPNKEAMFDAIVEIVIEETGAIPSVAYDPVQPLRDQLVAALEVYLNAIMDDRYIGLNRMVMTEYLRDRDLAKRIFANAEMSNNPLRELLAGAIKAKAIQKVDPDYATTLLTSGAKAFFFWPKFILGDDPTDETSDILGDCVDMFLAVYSNRTDN